MINNEELVYALRNNVGVSDYSRVAANLAADRIEALVKDNMLLTANKNAAHMLRDNYFLRAKEAEAKLAKVVEALRKLITCVDDGCYCSEMRMASTMDEACEVLAELEKTDD